MEGDRSTRSRSSSSRALVNQPDTLAAELRTIAEDIASSVGREVFARRKAGFSWDTKSTSTDVVTEIDTWAEAAIVSAIANVRPDDGLLGEEGASDPGTSGVVWVIDPVDGTTNLLYDLSGYNVSIGAELDGVAIAGAVYDPVRAELFSAASGQGATRTDADGQVESVTPSGEDRIGHALVATGFSYSADRRREQAQSLVDILPEVRDIRRLGAAALDLCAVACGRVDAYFETGLKHWDRSAGALIAAEAGAVVTVGEVVDDLTIAAAPGISEALQNLLKNAVI